MNQIFFWKVRVNHCPDGLIQHQPSSGQPLGKIKFPIKLDGVGPVDKRPSTSFNTLSEKEKKKITGDM